jgi:hypothetical protein
MKKIILSAVLCLLLSAGFSQIQCPSYFRVNNGSCGGAGTSELDLYFDGGCPSVPYPVIDSVYYQGEKLDVTFLTPDGSNCEAHNYISYCISSGNIPPSIMLTIYTNYGDSTGGGTQGSGIIVCDVVAGGPLPVIVTGLWTSRNSSHVVTRWETTQEIDILNFQLQRSFDGVSFQNLATLPSRGTGIATTSYTFTDNNNYSKNLTFYRLRINDIHGGYTYSYIKDVSGMRTGNDVGLYPNPAGGNSLIHLSQSYTEGTVQILDNSGRLMQTISLQSTGSFQLHNLNRGMYMVKITDKTSGEVLVKKITVTD